MRIFVLFLLTVLVVCLTIIFVYTSLILWPYREALAILTFLTLMSSFLTWVWVTARAKLVEQVLRLARIRYNEEIPLDQYGEAQYLPQGFTANKRRITSNAYFVDDEEE